MTVKELCDENLAAIEKEANEKKAALGEKEANDEKDNIIWKLLFGSLLKTESFKFNIGEKVLLKEISKFVNGNILDSGYTYFAPGATNKTKQKNTIPSVYGELFIPRDSNYKKVFDNSKSHKQAHEVHEKTKKSKMAKVQLVPQVKRPQCDRKCVLSLQELKSILVDNLHKRAVMALHEHVKSSPKEKGVMKKFGFTDIDESFDKRRIKIVMEEKDIERILDVSNNGFAGGILCYCGSEASPASCTVNFRANHKFKDMATNEGKERIESASDEFVTCWNIYNFKRHLQTHAKLSQPECLENTASSEYTTAKYNNY
jgi:hypothetical protein